MSRRNWYLLTNSVVLVWITAGLMAVGVHRFVDQPLWLMVHVPLLGAATAAILIWSQHFADTLLRRPALGGRVGLGIRLLGHTVGAALIVVGILAGVPPLAVTGAIGVAAVALAHGIVLTLQLRHALPARFAPLVRYYIAASAVFLGGIAAGIVIVLTGEPGTADRLVMSHLVLNVFGWLGVTVLGTLVLLWPTVLHARVPDSVDSATRRALVVLLAGLAVASAGPVLDLPVLVTLGMATWVAGAGLLAIEGWRESRSMPPATFAGWSLAAAFVWVLVGAIILGVLAAIAPDWESLRSQYLAVLGPLVVGFGTQIVIGALSYLLPVVALGSPSAAKAGAEILDRGAAFRVVAFNGAIALYLTPMPSLARVLLSLVVAGVVTSFLILAARAVIVGRRIRRSEGDTPDRSGIVSLGLAPERAPRPPTRRAGSLVAGFAVLALCVAAGVAADPAAVGISTAASTAGIAATGETTEVTIRVDGMRFTPALIEVPYGDALRVTFENTGADVHDLTFANGVRTDRLAPGATHTIDVGVIGSDLAGWCSIAGHRQMGMELTVRVTGAPEEDSSVASPAEPSEHTEHQPSGASGDAAAEIDLQREPSAGFVAWPAALPPASSGTVHRVTLRVEETIVDVAAGVSQARWTFGGTAPGPVLRGSIGDTFEITLVNDGTIGHSIDFHAGALAPDRPMRTIQPGESLAYTFIATKAGIWMYHCSTMPMSMHIANGMFGAVIIDPPGLAPVAKEYLLVQGELYLGATDETADADKIAAMTPDLVTFNGYADQYVHQPLEVDAGDRVRVWVLDAGPNSPSSFHVVGGQFDTVYLEGAYTLLPANGGGSQALGLQPAQGGFVEIEFAEPGNYPFVTHRMSDAEKGARGVFLVE